MATRTLYLVRHGEAGADGHLTDNGRRQAELTGQRLSATPIAAVHHGPLPRATQTAQLIATHLPGVPVATSELADDYVPYVPEQELLPPVWQGFLDGYTEQEITDGARRARDLVDRFVTPPDQDVHELVITHAFAVAWLVRHALDAPERRWLGLNQANCAVTVIRYSEQRPPTLVVFNDLSHLPEQLRWTGFPPPLRP
ncbi:histidine phosphatase family protein [Catellatospora tritici]|uniref:histidine phosphatase family protein n=1 Tax=Catellatospora tritici TaxID=2851566 RepID=UPI001C2D898E|nr:histidine phosphatase family protein [Catellatospora tritici]MBV1855224.1 histidine phosphatase family protein [Catellatospora tritici]